LRVILAGSRSITKFAHVEAAINASGLDITEVVCGEAPGVDKMGRYWAEQHKIPIKSFPADWDSDKRMAGFKRNVQMAEYADALIAVWDGWSTGTAHMIATAAFMGMPVMIYKPKGDGDDKDEQ